MRRWLLACALGASSLGVSGQALVPVSATWDMPPGDAYLWAEIERDATVIPCDAAVEFPTTTERRCTIQAPLGTATWRVRMLGSAGAQVGAWSEAIVATVGGSQPGQAPGPFTLTWHHVPPLTEPTNPEPHMAVEYEASLAPQTVDWSGAGGDQDFTFDAGSGPNRVLLVYWWARSDRSHVFSATYAGVPLTPVGSPLAWLSPYQARLFVLVAPASGSNTLRFSATAGDGSAPGQAAALVLRNVDQSTPLDTAVHEAESGSDATTTQSVSTSSATDDMVATFSSFGTGGFDTTGSVSGGSYTLRQQALHGGAGVRMIVGDAPGAATVTPATSYNNVATWWAARLAVNVNAASGGGANDYELELDGALAPAGVVVQQAARLVVGSVAPGGVLLRQPRLVRGGSVAPAGLARQQAATRLTGAVPPSGALTTVKAALQTLAGALGPAGVVRRAAAMIRGGSVAPAGVVRKVDQRGVAGSVSPSGTVTQLKAALQTLTGGVTPSGVVRRLTAARPTGTIGSAGVVVRHAATRMSGSASPSGTLQGTRLVVRTLTGAVGLAGTVRRQAQRRLAGSVAAAGAVTKAVGQVLRGMLTPSGGLITYLPSAPTTRWVTWRDETVARTAQGDRVQPLAQDDEVVDE